MSSSKLSLRVAVNYLNASPSLVKSIDFMLESFSLAEKNIISGLNKSFSPGILDPIHRKKFYDIRNRVTSSLKELKDAHMDLEELAVEMTDSSRNDDF